MGKFVNPDNQAFQVALNSEIYIDKTGLIAYTNRMLDTNQALICNSRPRRFGKSITANMLTAYYSCGCDSEKMFEGTKVKSVNTMNCEGKNRRRGMVVGKTAKTKKAIVALTADSKEIEIFAGL